MQVINATRSTLLATDCEIADSYLARLQGLMGRESLAQGSGLFIVPCSSVHTFFMRFPIDVIFVDRQQRVVGMRAAMTPNRPYAGAWKAHAVVELPAGTIAASATEVGDQLTFDPPR